MFKQLWRRVFRRAGLEPPIVIQLGELETLARAGPAAWLLAQEKARLEFLSAQASAKHERLLQLQATNALVQSLVNEYHLERMIAETPAVDAEDCAVRRSR